MLSWIVNSWDKFSIWVTNQPTFVEVAFGIGLFYVALQIARLLFKLIAFLFTRLLETSVRFTKRKDLHPGPHKKKMPPQMMTHPRLFFDKAGRH